MPRFVTSIIIFTVIIVMCVFSLVYVLKKEKTLEVYINDMKKYAEDENMEYALNSAIEFKDKWKEIEPYIIMMIRHNSIDEITIRSNRLIAYAKSNNKSEFLAEVYAIKALLHHIADNEKPLIHNFL